MSSSKWKRVTASAAVTFMAVLTFLFAPTLAHAQGMSGNNGPNGSWVVHTYVSLGSYGGLFYNTNDGSNYFSTYEDIDSLTFCCGAPYDTPGEAWTVNPTLTWTVVNTWVPGSDGRNPLPGTYGTAVSIVSNWKDDDVSGCTVGSCESVVDSGDIEVDYDYGCSDQQSIQTPDYEENLQWIYELSTAYLNFPGDFDESSYVSQNSYIVVNADDPAGTSYTSTYTITAKANVTVDGCTNDAYWGVSISASPTAVSN